MILRRGKRLCDERLAFEQEVVSAPYLKAALGQKTAPGSRETLGSLRLTSGGTQGDVMKSHNYVGHNYVGFPGTLQL